MLAPMTRQRLTMLLMCLGCCSLESVRSRSLTSDESTADFGTLKYDVTTSASSTGYNVETIVLNIVVDQKNVSLELKRNENIPTDTPVYLIENGVTTRWHAPAGQDVRAFSNDETLDTVTVSQQTDNNGTFKEYVGVFTVGDEQYSIMPAVYTDELGDFPSGEVPTNATPIPDKPSYVEIDGAVHAIVKRPTAANPTLLYDLPPEMAGNRRKRDISRKRRDLGGNTKQRYVVDYLAVIDYAIFNRWYSANAASTDSLRRQEAIRNIVTYYANIVNGIDSRYSTIQQNDFSINVRFVGYLIATNAGDSPWTEASDVTLSQSGTTYVDVSKVLFKLSAYVADNNFTQADHVALFTGNTLYTGLSSGRPVPVSGLAFIGTICDAKTRVSVVREFGQYSTVQSAAHELGHNLGAMHDGDANACSGQDQFVMASSPGQLTIANFKNPFAFSSCSMSNFRNTLSALTSNGANCLLRNGGPAVSVGNVNLGQQYAVDKQCQQLYGPNSFFCAGGVSDSTICSKMLCWDPRQQNCVLTTEQRAFDGTTCGNRKWCLNGQCVSDGGAPTANDVCVYGDYRGILYVDGLTPMTCSGIGAKTPSACYDQTISSQCCKTCEALSRTDHLNNGNANGCAFGDRNPSYCSQNTARDNCYDPNYFASCCATCRSKFDSALNASAGCGYGDKAGWCSTQDSSACYTSSDVCCAKCAGFKTDITGCEYGDRASWCSQSNYLSDSCKDPGFASTCCKSCASTEESSTSSTTPSSGNPTKADLLDDCSSKNMDQCYALAGSCCTTCQQYYTNIQGCEYGDVSSSCSNDVRSASDCHNANIAQQCCKTCLAYQSNNCTDKASWCSTIYSGQCYDSQTRFNCCATCSQRRTSNPCCLYGDKYSWCKTDYCSTNTGDCCATC